MNDQIKLLQNEKQATLDAIEIARQELKNLYDEMNRLKSITDDKDGKIADLDAAVDYRYDQMEQYEQDILSKQQRIKELQNQLAYMLNRSAPPKFQIYKPVPGDVVDEALAEYINQYGSPVPWKREGPGRYLYGTKKVNVTFMRQNLIIKVGGGSMVVEEFIATYEAIELAKLNY